MSTATVNPPLLGVYHFELFDLPKQRILSVEKSYLELREDWMQFGMIFRAETPKGDEEYLWEEDTHHWISTRKRDEIASVDMYFDQPKQCYTVEVETHGAQTPIRINYQQREEAEVMQNRLARYYLRKD